MQKKLAETKSGTAAGRAAQVELTPSQPTTTDNSMTELQSLLKEIKEAKMRRAKVVNGVVVEDKDETGSDDTDFANIDLNMATQEEEQVDELLSALEVPTQESIQEFYVSQVISKLEIAVQEGKMTELEADEQIMRLINGEMIETSESAVSMEDSEEEGLTE